MAKYPIYIEMSGRRIVVIGAGAVASRKVKVLYEAGADILVVAKQITPEFTERCLGFDINVTEGEYSKAHLADAMIAIAATNDTQLNEQIYADCKELNVLCNVVDVPYLCDFYVPAIVQRGPLQIAIGTDGKSPAYSSKLRKQLESVFTETHGQFVLEMGVMRQQIIEDIANPKIRKQLFAQLVSDHSFEIFTNDGPQGWRIYAKNLIEEQTD